MSYKVQNLAWKVEGLKSSTKFVLIALCDYANKKKGYIAWPAHSKIAKRTGLSIRSVQRAVKVLCDLGLISYRHRYDQLGNQRSNLYKINRERLKEVTRSSKNVVRMTPLPSHDDRGGIVTVTDKPLHQTFNITSKNSDFGDEVIGTNFDNRPITEQRRREICEELGFNLDLED